ncbi:MAG: hypothetical protein ACOCXJ_09655, partial [Planctomycetota bacterium]
MTTARADHCFELLRRSSRILPPGFAWWLGAVIGDAVGRFPGVEQQRCRRHLEHLVPREQTTSFCRRVFRHVGRSALWSLATLDRDPRRLHIRIQGREHLSATLRAARAGQGTVILSGHFGNWELLARLFG